MSARNRTAAAIYEAGWMLALPVVLVRLWLRGRTEPEYRRRWRQRLGYWSGAAAPPTAPAPRVWLHAVSLGETRAAGPLVRALREALPGMQLLLTTGTATGWQAGGDLLQAGDLHGWIPLDTRWATRRFFAACRPDLGVLMETETWPNLLGQAALWGVPMVLANARLSERSLRKGQRWPALTQPMMQGLRAVLAQTGDDERRLAAAGVPASRLRVVGNLKYDLQPDEALIGRGRAWAQALRRKGPPRRVVLAASWREGEDAPLLQSWAQHTAAAVDERPLLLLVPRHPQRFDEVQATLLQAGLRVSRRSTWGPHGPDEAACRADVWLGDSLGEMPAYYAAADIALLGGSFAPLGGQNLIEAAACGCPVVMGPHTFNFEDAAERAVQESAAVRVQDLSTAVQTALAMPAPQIEHHRASGLAFSARHAGAAHLMAQAIAALWSGRGEQR